MRVFIERVGVVVGVVLLAAGCAGSRSDQRATAGTAGAARPATRPGQEMQGMARMCPMEVPDTKVSAADTSQGEALTFTTGSGQVDELRRRVRALTDMHGQHHAAMGAGAAGAGQGGSPGQASADAHAGHLMPPPSRASVEDVDQGARVSIVPEDPAKVDQLRAAVRMHAQHMQTHGCGMMQGGPR
jgi:hypothetical protein